MTDSPYPIHSQEWWEQYLSESWDANGGGNQTRYFMQLVLEGLHASEKQFLQQHQLTVLDWGCAFGEGVELFTQRLPRSRVVGLDFAPRAIEEARRRYSSCEFILSEGGVIRGKYDVIVTSNRLEHFEYPIEIVKTQLNSCQLFYVALVPYNESPLREEHLTRFKEEFFPEQLAGFRRIHTKIMDADPLYWRGKQLLIVYASPSYLRTRVGYEKRALPEDKTDDDQLQALSFEISEKERALSEAVELVAEKERQLTSLIGQLAQKDEEIKALSLRAIEEERRARSLSMELITRDEEVKSLAKESGAAAAQLERIKRSPGWRLLSTYGRFKYRYLLPLYKALRLTPYGADAEGEQKSHLRWESEQKVGSASGPASREIESRYLANVSPHSNAHDIVCFPIIEWDFRFQRPQQMMLKFASAGHRVFYISQRFRSTGSAFVVERKHQNVYEVSLLGLERTVYTDLLDETAQGVLFAALDELRRELRLGATVSFVQLPFWWPLAERARAEFAWPVIYDCMDHHAGFSTNNQKMLDYERDLLTSSDLVVASSRLLEDEARARNSNVLLLRNACEYDHFARSAMTTNGRPVVGYYGAIADWFDSNLVADLAEARPDWDFWLIGSTFSADISRLSNLPNVSLLGEKPYSEISGWVTQFDVAIIPFKRTPLTEATNPVKAYEILAAGKPLVSVGIPEVAEIAPLVRLASTATEFEQQIQAALSEDAADAVVKRRAFAREHTWEKRYETLAPVVVSVFPKVSIVIVTFNNVELNRLCLESVYACTDWPNFEVIVVDNASSDGTPEYLHEAKAKFPNLQVVLNQTNAGFAAANNQGLKQASGDYLVLLNNDTVVTHRWVSALIRHLNADPKIGLIGPVTNAIGNEAQIEAGYESIDDMPSWAAKYVRENDGRTFSIPMVAMFSVATRRTVVDHVGMLDERFGIGMFEDDDYNRRVRDAGYDIRCARDSFVHHWQKSSFRLLGEQAYLRIFEENRRKFEVKWGETWKAEGVRLWNRPDLGFYRDQVASIVQRARKRKGAIVFLPSVGWGIHLFQRPHHLARVFAEHGYLSVFDCSNAQDDVNGFKEIYPDVYLFRGPEELLHEIPDAVLWTLPYNFHCVDGYPKTARTVYDWIDDLEVFPYDRDLLERNHARALKEATIVTAVARCLHEQALVERPDAVYLPNGVEAWRFADESIALPEDEDIEAFRRSGRPIAGYYGALAKWFDYDLIDAIARLRPDWNFLLIGPMYDDSLRGRPMLKRPNVAWIGPRSYESLAGYLKLFDVAMIPFLINDITLATSPLKLFEYFAGGKPVITTPMPECEAFPEVQVAKSAQEFSQALDRALELGRDKDYRSRVRALADENSWAVRVQTVEQLLRRDQPTDDTAQLASAPGIVGEAQRAPETKTTPFQGMSFHRGTCNICGNKTLFFYTDVALYRESLACRECLSTSRYRSIARGILRAIHELTGVHAESIAGLIPVIEDVSLNIYDTQVPFYYEGCAYPVPDLLSKCKWINLETSLYRHKEEFGIKLGANISNQNLERLTFPDNTFDLVITSDVMEHVRLDEEAHREIRRVLRPGGVYVFTVPHFRNRETLVRVRPVDPADPAKDEFLTEKEYHGDANSEDSRALSYRSYGTELDEFLRGLGFSVEYCKRDFPNLGIMNTELFYCKLSK